VWNTLGRCSAVTYSDSGLVEVAMVYLEPMQYQKILILKLTEYIKTIFYNLVV
jgi:hypothetical protein